jgi:hypothetical protein
LVHRLNELAHRVNDAKLELVGDAEQLPPVEGRPEGKL